MKTQIITVVAATILALIAGSQLLNQKSASTIQDNAFFEEWALKHGKTYSSPAEKQFRFKVFLKNKSEVEKVNSSKRNFRFALNKFSDMTEDEFKSKYLGYRAGSVQSELEEYPENFSAPDSIDWRDKGAVTYVKDQGHCGSCWAFSATGSTEAAYFLKNNKLIPLSEQQLVDCSELYGNMGCNGGLPQHAFNFYKDHAVIPSPPYIYWAQKQVCEDHKWKSSELSKIARWKSNKDNETALMNSVALRPTSVGVYAVPWLQYGGGIYDDLKSCPASKLKIDHAVLAVGYGSENGKNYWIIKNSWGTGWGEKGYIRLGRGLTEKGICGVAMETNFPEF